MLSRTMKKIVAIPFLFLLLLALAACGGGGGSSSSSDRVGGGGSGATGTSGASIVAMTSSALQLDQTIDVVAVLRNADNSPAAGVPVNFTTTLGSFTSETGVVRTDANGRALIELNAGSQSGKGRIIATATVGNQVVNLSTLFDVVLPPLKLAKLTLVDNTDGEISYGSTQAVTVEVQNLKGELFTAQSVDVVFSSTQAASGKATISSPVATVKGVASATYTALTATGEDVITATIAGSTEAISLVINPLEAGSISYVSSTPKTIGLKGMGGSNVVETSIVKFRVVDTSGAPKRNQPVAMTLNTAVGGLKLTGANASGVLNASTAEDGTVSAIVQAGSVSTPVRVTATTNVVVDGKSTEISTQSDELVVSTGIPSQSRMSLAVETHNVEAFDRDGVQNVFTVFLADHFGNPVPDGTAVNFSAQVGQIRPTCTTVNGRCSATWTSSGERTYDGKAAILAYAIGEESFSDPNGSGEADGLSTAACLAAGDGNLQVSVRCGEFIDTTQAWRDDAHVGYYVPGGPDFIGDFIVDFNKTGKVDRDGVFNGILRDASVTGARTKHVFANNVIVMSTSKATINNLDVTKISASTGTAASTTVTGSVQDANPGKGIINPMPAGTKIDISSLSSCLSISPPSFIVPNTTDGPNSFSTSVNNTCKTGVDSPGTITVTVTSPAGLITRKNFSLSW